MDAASRLECLPSRPPPVLFWLHPVLAASRLGCLPSCFGCLPSWLLPVLSWPPPVLAASRLGCLPSSFGRLPSWLGRKGLMHPISPDSFKEKLRNPPEVCKVGT